MAGSYRGRRANPGVGSRHDDPALPARARRQPRVRRRSGVHGEGTWSAPGGHLEFGESFEDCAAREAREETGVTVTASRVITMANDVLEGDGRHYVTVWVVSDHQSGDGEPLATYELDEVQWFARDELPSPLFAPLTAAIAAGVLDA